MDWTGASRTNYVRVADLEGLKNALAVFPISIEAGEGKTHGMHCLISHDEYGSWPLSAVDPDTDNEVQLDEYTHILPFIMPGQVLIIMEAGHEGQRYVSGFASAFLTTPPYESVSVALFDIYELAKAQFGIEPTQAQF
jgi:hypothetical protein